MRTRSRLLSVLIVLVTACSLDLLAEGPSLHVVAVAGTAAAVGVARSLLRGNTHGVVALLNVAVLAQPAAHAATTLTHTGASRLAHDHVIPEGVAAVALQLAVALLVVVVAANESILVVGISAGRCLLGLSRLLLGTPAPTVAPPARPRDEPQRPPGVLALARCRPRRGPPLGLVGSPA